MLSGRVVIEHDELVRRGQDQIEFHVDLTAKDTAAEGGARIIEGITSSGTVDRVGDVVEPFAFKRTIKAFRSNPIILAHHSPWLGMGVMTDIEVQDSGVWIRARIGTGTSPMDDLEIIWNRMQQRIYRALSIGFRILRREDILQDGRVTGWRILDLDLYEVSIVAIPANSEALFDIGKAVLYGTDLDYDLYARGLWGIPPRLPLIATKSSSPVVRPGRNLRDIDARISGLTQAVAAHAGGKI